MDFTIQFHLEEIFLLTIEITGPSNRVITQFGVPKELRLLNEIIVGNLCFCFQNCPNFDPKCTNIKFQIFCLFFPHFLVHSSSHFAVVKTSSLE